MYTNTFTRTLIKYAVVKETIKTKDRTCGSKNVELYWFLAIFEVQKVPFQRKQKQISFNQIQFQFYQFVACV